MALEMTKWFDTNYHYLVPELDREQTFKLASSKPFDEFAEALSLGLRTMPVLVGPLTFLLLAKTRGESFDRLSLLPKLLSVYADVLRRLQIQGAEWVQLDEPALCLDLTSEQRAAFGLAYQELRKAAPGLKFLLATYFGELRDNLSTACRLPVDALHFDAVRAPREIGSVAHRIAGDDAAFTRVVDGRNIWRNDFEASLKTLRKAANTIGTERLMISPSCSLLHSPISLKYEAKLDVEIKGWLAFAEEKLSEIGLLAKLVNQSGDNAALLQIARPTPAANKASASTIPWSSCGWRRYPGGPATRKQFHHPPGKTANAVEPAVVPDHHHWFVSQTEEIRGARARFKKGELSSADYAKFLEQQTAECVRWQEEAGLDVPVHGEFERNDMVEYFGEQLAGFGFTENGWVQSYGSRCVKPPIIYGDVSRARPMTVRWSKFAQSLTKNR